MHKVLPFVLVVAALTALSVNAAPQKEQPLSVKLENPVSDYHLSGNGMVNTLARVAQHFELPVGIEWVRNGETLRSFNLEWKASTIRGILSSVVDRYPGYVWKLQDGVVHVFRSDLVAEKGNFLNLTVPNRFKASREAGGFINWRLRFAVQNLVSPRRLPPGAGVGGSYATGTREKPITLDLQGLTIRQALDKLVSVSEHKVWVVTFSGAGRTPAGFLRTETLWHPTPFPDGDQPMWDFLSWQEFVRISASLR